MSIINLNSITSNYKYISYKKYEYKFGDLDLLYSGGIFGQSQLSWGIFYDNIILDTSAQLVFSSESSITGQ